jgi:hypothetical protein
MVMHGTSSDSILLNQHEKDMQGRIKKIYLSME